MSPKVILLASICLNAGLGIAFIISPKSSTSETLTETGKAGSNQPVVNKKTAKPLVVTNVIEPEFNWRQVEAADYKEYIAKLRGIGCPEATIRDIIIADIDKLYEPKMAALRDLPTYQPDKFWVADMAMYGGVPRKRDPEKVAAMKALTEERAALIKELLGVEEKELRQAYSSYEDQSESQLSFLSQEQRDKVKELTKKYNEERSKIYEDAGRYFDSETQGELAKLRKKMLADMKGFMTPEQVFEYDIRTSDTARNMKYELRGFEPTEEEFRAMYAARQAQEDARPTSGEKLTPEQIQQNRDAAKLAQDNLKATLGDERYKEMELAKDYGYRQLVSAAPFLGYDKAAVANVLNMKTDAEKAASEIRRNQALSPEERSKALEQIRTATEAAVAKEIGDKGFKYYKRQGGYWLNNISPRPVVRTTP